jgi:hypothetical protein
MCRVACEVKSMPGLPRKGVAGSQTFVQLFDPSTAVVSMCRLDRVGMRLGSELILGVEGAVDGQPFTVRRLSRFALLRSRRTLHVSGVVDLLVCYRRFEKTVRSGARPEAVLWTSRSGGRMSNQASIEEAGVICALVINDFPSASSFLARFLSGI